MPNPTFAKTWNFAGLNQRISYVSLLDTSARLLYGIKNYLVGTMGASVVFSCDGTTGPSSQVDNTDRWSSFADCDTRAAAATPGAARSSVVIAWGGGQLLLDFSGATDDVFRVAFSQGALFRAPTAAASFTFTAAFATDICTAVAHGQVTGDGPFFLTVGGGAPSPLVINTPYWITRLTNDTFYLCASYANALAGIPVDIGTVGTPPNTLTCLSTVSPFATDEVRIATGISMIDATASLDRVFSVQATTDRSIFRVFCHRAAVLTQSFGLERIVEGFGIPSGTLLGWNSNAPTANANSLNNSGHHGGFQNTSVGGANSMGVFVMGAIRVCAGGTVAFNGNIGATGANGTIFPLNGAAIIWPLYVGHNVIASAGFIGTRIDAFFHHSLAGELLVGAASDDLAAGTRLVWVGTMMTPWSTSVPLVRT